MAKETPAIAEAEWKVMRVLWRRSPLAAYDVVQELAPQEQWHPNTIKTLLARLVKKKAVATRKYKNLFYYEPALTQEECIAAESETFLKRCFDGAVQPLLVHFAKNKKVSKADVDELRRILEGKGKDNQ